MQDKINRSFTDFRYTHYCFIEHSKCIFSGGTSEEEEEIGGSAGRGEGRSVGNGHSGWQCAHLQYSKRSASLYPGEFET